MSNLYLIRHGQSLWNLENKFTGSINIPLSTFGREQAQSLCQFFASLAVDYAYTSSLIRAQETALIALADIERTCQLIKHIDELMPGNLALQFDARLDERNYGSLQGMNKTAAAKQFGAEQIKAWRRSFSSRPDNGESLADTCVRVAEFISSELQAKLDSKQNIAIFAHGNSIRAMHKLLTNTSEQAIINFEVNTAEILHYTYTGGEFELQA